MHEGRLLLTNAADTIAPAEFNARYRQLVSAGE
jgi:hypothetical protein